MSECPHLSRAGVCGLRGEPVVHGDQIRCRKIPEWCWEFQRARADAAEKDLQAAEKDAEALAAACRSAREQCENPGCDDWHRCDSCSPLESALAAHAARLAAKATQTDAP